MAAKKTHYYVIVMSENGPIFVTKVNHSNHTAEWNYKEKPLELAKSVAEDLALGLNLNLHSAYLVAQPFEIEVQPYNYKSWKIEWTKREDKEDEDC